MKLEDKENVQMADQEVAVRRDKLRMARNTAIIVAILAILFALGYHYKSVFVAATVNGKPISRLAVIKELEKQGGNDVLDTLINKKLIENEAQSKNIVVSQNEIDQEIKKFEDQFNVNGHTLDESLAAQGLTRDDLKGQIVIQKQIEKLLGDKVAVTDDELNTFIKDNGIAITPENESSIRAQAKDQLTQQKLASESAQFINDLNAKAKIKKFVSY